ncbi:hypothetical protein [uncultured Sphingomonas sp.]|uniref:hypothetical protein n=1 Tax=uncultured Sphingomonas sp. TaxID=158754 RepID=UPI0035CAB7DC
MAEHLTMSVTEFKAKCLNVITRIANHDLSGVTLTRRRKPVTELSPPRPTRGQVEALFGCMAGTVIIPPGVDLTAPIAELEDWEPELRFDR